MAIKLAPDAFDFPEGAAPATPDTGYVRLYAKADNRLYQKDDTGIETPLGGGAFTDFLLAGDTGTPETVAGGETVTLAGGTGIDTVVSATNTVTFAIDSTVATLTGAQTLANKILSQLHLLISGFKAIFTHAFTADRTVTLPGDANVTLVGADTTQDLSNKTFTDQVFIDGSADEIQLRIQGNSTQGASLASFENNTGDVQFSISNTGAVVINETGNSPQHSLRVESDLNANAFVVGGADGEIGIGIDPAPMSSSDLIVNIVSTVGMLGIPAMDNSEQTSLNPRDGALCYDTDLERFIGKADGIHHTLAFDTRYGAMITHNANQTFANSTTTTLSFNTTVYDSGHGFSNTAGADPTFTIPTGLGGLYCIGFNGRWSDNAAALNNCNVDIVTNSGATIIASALAQKGAFTTGVNSLTQNIVTIYPLADGDQVEIQARHQSVAGTGITANADYSPRFWIFRISD